MSDEKTTSTVLSPKAAAPSPNAPTVPDAQPPEKAGDKLEIVLVEEGDRGILAITPLRVPILGKKDVLTLEEDNPQVAPPADLAHARTLLGQAPVINRPSAAETMAGRSDFTGRRRQSP